MFLLCLCLILLEAAFVGVQATSLVRVGETWQYFPAVSEPAGPPGAWRSPGFQALGWSEGPSGFSTVNGYFTEATIVQGYGGAFSSVYFRRTFNVQDANSIKWLLLRIDYDDAFIAYINGVEIARRHLPEGPVHFDTIASSPRNRVVQGLGPEEIDISASKNLLVNGENVLAISVHGAGTPDFYFGLVPELRANFLRGPVLQNARSNAVNVLWKTPQPSDARVDYGTSISLGKSVSLAESANLHLATIADLLPDTLYYYKVSSTISNQTASSPIESFRTLKTGGKVSFTVAGDPGQGGIGQQNVAKVMKEARPDMVMLVGDTIYPSFYSGFVDIRHFSIYEPQMKSTPFFLAAGNHDSYWSTTEFYNTFSLPTNNVTQTEHWYSFDNGDAHFVVLNSDLSVGMRYDAGTPQYLWLESDLAATKKPWKFFFFHHTIRTSSYHAVDDADFNGELDMIQLQKSVGALAEKYGVSIIFTGHDHIYERFNPVNGVFTVVSGGGGAFPYPFVRAHPDSSQFFSQYHTVKVDIDGPKLSMKTIDLNGQIIDWMTIYQRGSTNLQNGKFETPVIDNKPGDDSDGNIAGQTFNFSGAPIPTVSGQSANLGQVFVSNDRENLYLGLEQVMIGSDHNLLLFIESPRRIGMTSMLPVGNGVLDPDGQGADGLDILKNLSFTNFSPVIGCILGDEFGDGQYRSFLRPGATSDFGQGVYYLNSTLADVPGTRVQQFNRSPQQGIVGYEENANFIEIAIPFSTLGGLRPGDTIKIGAVVAKGGLDTTGVNRFREIDTSYLGAKLHGSGLGQVALEGLSVKLAEDPDPLAVRLQIHSASVGAFRPKLSWSSTPGKQYVLQSSGNVVTGYQDILNPLFPMKAGPNDFTLSYEEPVPVPPRRFYRVRVLQP